MRKYLKIIICCLLFIIIIFGIIYFLNENKQYGNYDSYSYNISKCKSGIKLFDLEGINQLKWLDETTLYIKATTSINCAREIEKVYVKNDNNEIYLSYSVDFSNKYAQCNCGRTIEFEVKNLNSSKEYIVKFKENKKEYFTKIKNNETYGLNLIPYITNLTFTEFENQTFKDSELRYDNNGVNTNSNIYNWIDNSTLNVTAKFELNCNEKLININPQYQDHYQLGNSLFIRAYYSPENNAKTNLNAGSGIKGNCRKIVKVNFKYNDFEKKEIKNIFSWI